MLRRAAAQIMLPPLHEACASSHACAAGAAACAGMRSYSSSPGAPELLEMREYTLKPEGISEFMRLTKEFVWLRSQLLPFLGMFTCDTGGTLNRVVHFYNYKDFDERDRARKRGGSNISWQEEYLANSRTCVAHQESRILVPSLKVLEAAGAVQPSQFRSPPRAEGGKPVVYEMRSYTLQPGWGSVPKAVEAFAKGLPAKIAADPAAAGKLVFFGHTDVGLINSMVELWRYDCAQDSIRARQAARGVAEWRAAVDTVASVTQRFETAYLHPTPFSPWQ